MARRPNVRRLQRRGDADGLAYAARYREIITDAGRRTDLGVAIRRNAVEALGAIEPRPHVDVLITALNDDAESVRYAAIGALAGCSQPEAIDAVADAALAWDGPGDADFRRQALRVLDDLAAEEHGDTPRRVALRYLDGAAGDEELGRQVVATVMAHAPRAVREEVVVVAVDHLD